MSTPAAAPSTRGPDAHARHQRLAASRWASRAQFAALGLLGGAWGVHIPTLKARHGFDEQMLSLVLLTISLGAVSSLFFAGRVIGRLGARRTAQGAALVMGLLLALALWPPLPWLLPMMVVFGASMSLFDVAINAEGTALEALGGRAVMGSLHGMFSTGGMAGAALAAWMLKAEVAPMLQLSALGAVIVLMVWVSSRWMLDAHPHEEGPRAHFVWPRGLLLLIGLLIFTGMTAEGVMYDWCVLYLKQELGMPQAQAGLGFAAFSFAMALARFGGDAVRARVSERRILGVGAALAAVSMATLLVVGHPLLALFGYVLVGAGLALVVPILYTAATRVPGVSRAAAIASVSSIGYSGFLIGPPLIGAIAHHFSLTAAMGLVVMAALALALGARRIG